MSCDVGKATEGLENELWRRWSDGKVEEWEKLCSFSNPSVALPTSQLILQTFRCFTYVTAHSPTLLSLLLRHRLFTYVTWWAAHDVKNGWDIRGPVSAIYEQSSFSKVSVTSPTSQLILQPFRRFINVTAHSPTPPLLHLRHSSFSNPSFASPTSQALHLRHMASRPWSMDFAINKLSWPSYILLN